MCFGTEIVTRLSAFDTETVMMYRCIIRIDFAFCLCFYDGCSSFSTFSFGHCVVCSSSISSKIRFCSNSLVVLVFHFIV